MNFLENYKRQPIIRPIFKLSKNTLKFTGKYRSNRNYNEYVELILDVNGYPNKFNSITWNMINKKIKSNDNILEYLRNIDLIKI
jgi:hypothetical protein